jgi:predicted transcriptional regulator
VKSANRPLDGLASGIPRIAEVMTPFPYSIDVNCHAGDAQRILVGRAIHHLPVTSDGEVFSVLSTLNVQSALAIPGADPWAIQVRELCSEDPCIVDISTPLDAVLTEMAQRRVDCAVVAEDDRVAGIFTNADAYLRFAQWLRASQARP